MGLTAVITPFDEISVGLALEHGVEILKVASCSATDWPLLEEIACAKKPVICSTGGCRIQDIDRIVTFFEHRGIENLSLLHCVGIYPTENKDQNLGFLRKLMRRYPHCRIGFSGHERPTNSMPSCAAVAMGARILERHVGIPGENSPLNAYSMNPDEVERWVVSVLETLSLCGNESLDKPVSEAEVESLSTLKRGVFAKRPIQKNAILTEDDVFFAMPWQSGQMSASEWRNGLISENGYSTNEPLLEKRPFDLVQIMRNVVHEAKGFLREANITVGSDYEIELSHHFGMEKFRRFGAIIVNYFNREYCKKLIILLPGQEHPSHFHQNKEETFQVLFGQMTLVLDGCQHLMKAGDIQLIRRGQRHSFSTRNGVVFEEISTTHVKGDSHYEDSRISSLDPVQRKTLIKSW